jgi:ElaB/YqjD/DUF883 family membrane-anchored ribosome-binding protein
VTAPRRPQDHGGQLITIGLRDLYDQIQELSKNYAALASKIDTGIVSQTLAVQSIAQQIADLRHDFTDHEARLRVQEAKVYITPRAMWTGIGVITGVMGTLLVVLQVILNHS